MRSGKETFSNLYRVSKNNIVQHFCITFEFLKKWIRKSCKLFDCTKWVLLKVQLQGNTLGRRSWWHMFPAAKRRISYRNINLSPTEGFTFVLFFILYIPKCKIFFTYTSSQIPNNSILYESVFPKLIFQTQVVLHPNVLLWYIKWNVLTISYLYFYVFKVYYIKTYLFDTKLLVW